MRRGEVSADSEAPRDVPICGRCGQPAAADEFIQVGPLVICARCKPLYLQQLREGVPTVPAALRYAGFWIRGGAVFIDGLLFYVAGVLIWVATGQSWKEAAGFERPYPTVDEWSVRDWMVCGAEHLVNMAYFTVMVPRYGGSVGKLALRLRVVNADGQSMTYAKAFRRNLALYLSMPAFLVTLPETTMLYLLPFLGGLVMAAFDSQKRALHDRLCGTRVIHRPKAS